MVKFWDFIGLFLNIFIPYKRCTGKSHFKKIRFQTCGYLDILTPCFFNLNILRNRHRNYLMIAEYQCSSQQLYDLLYSF